MTIYDHFFDMNTFRTIDSLLSGQTFAGTAASSAEVTALARAISAVENSIVVVSDLMLRSSRIFSGAFADTLGLSAYASENSIWEKQILSLMSEHDREEKFLAEIRLLSFLRRIPRRCRPHYYLLTQLRFTRPDRTSVDVCHRMYYLYDGASDAIRFGICVYTPAVLSIPAGSIAVNSLTGESHSLLPAADGAILSDRQIQVLRLIERGLTSDRIASQLFISRNTVSRHRQEILARLQGSNSAEACRLARRLNLL